MNINMGYRWKKTWVAIPVVAVLFQPVPLCHPDTGESASLDSLREIVRQSLERVGSKWNEDAKERYSNSLAQFLTERLPHREIQQRISELRAGFPWIARVHGLQPIRSAIEVEYYTEQAKWWLKLWLHRPHLTLKKQRSILEQVRELLEWAIREASKASARRVTVEERIIQEAMNEIKAQVENPICPHYKHLLSPSQVSRVKKSFSRWIATIGRARQHQVHPKAKQVPEPTQVILQRMLRLIETVGSYRPPRRLRSLGARVSLVRDAATIENEQWLRAQQNRRSDVCNEQELFDWLVWVLECTVESMRGNNVWAFGPW